MIRMIPASYITGWDRYANIVMQIDINGPL